MIINTPSNLPEQLIGKPVLVDVETTSYDDKVEGFNPYQGHRVAGYAFGPLEDETEFYLPVRHEGQENCEFEPAIKFCKDLIEEAPYIVNHNIKFDAKFWRHDSINDTCILKDTMILSRLVHNDLMRYSLDALCALFFKEMKDEKVKAYLKQIKSKDYGRVPIEIIGPYAERDILLTRKLYNKLLKLLPKESLDVWETEQKLTRILLDGEHRGIRVDQTALKKASIEFLTRMIDITEELSKFAGYEFDPKKRNHVTDLLTSRGLKPQELTPTGLPKWDTDTLKALDDPCASLIDEYSHLEHLNSTYCTGWLEKLGTDGRLHPDNKQSGARTGRLSCANPNSQNMPKEAEAFVLPEKGEDILSFDYSQIEYRIFAHYTNDPSLIKQYADDPDTDFHQALADSLGILRSMSKSLNFGFIYGMGKKKLLKSLVSIGITEEMLDKFCDEEKNTELAASRIYSNYHKEFPSIKTLQRRVENKARTAGTLRNYFGRIYRFDDKRFTYRGLNYLCQGSAADLFKKQLVKVSEEFPELKIMVNVHDSVFWSAPSEYIKENFYKIKNILEDVEPKLRIPIFVEGKISTGNMAEAKAVEKVEDFYG